MTKASAEKEKYRVQAGRECNVAQEKEGPGLANQGHSPSGIIFKLVTEKGEKDCLTQWE